ncbi:hypothetical protein [Actinoplanes ianthinogenes]|uniref:hypothetical protein n=1 Tax=Actinoplanes ianthinogenes TaxID=122358 RepID=UPI001670FF0E|nr:hypothetical protein [Actinoplanes ianthinogenes]
MAQQSGGRYAASAFAGVRSGLRRALQLLRRVLPFPSIVRRDLVWRQILSDAREHYGLWRAIEPGITKDLPREAARKLRSRYRRGCVRSSATWYAATRIVVNVCVVLAACFPIMAVVIGAVAVMRGLHDLPLLFLSVAVFIIMSVPVYIAVRLINRMNGRLSLIALVLGLAGIFIAYLVVDPADYFGLSLVTSAPASAYEAIAKGAAYSGICCLLLAAMILLTFLPAWSILSAYQVRASPFDMALRSGLNVGLVIAGIDYDLAEPWVRRWGIQDLEVIARCLEKGFLRAVPLPRARERALVQARLVASAAEIRGWQATVALPDPVAVSELKEKVSTLLAALLTADFGKLPGFASEISIRPQRIGEALRYIRDLIVSCIPVAALIVADRMEAPLDGVLATGFWAFAVVWLVVGLVMTISPTSISRVDKVKEIMSVVRSPES